MAVPNWSDAVIDGGLNFIDSNVTRVDVCTTEPTTYAEATTTYTIGNYTLDAADWTIANGDTSGRKVTMGAQTGNNSTGTGAANFLAFTNGSNTLYGVIAADGDSVTSGNPLNLSAVDVWEIRDPT